MPPDFENCVTVGSHKQWAVIAYGGFGFDVQRDDPALVPNSLDVA